MMAWKLGSITTTLGAVTKPFDSALSAAAHTAQKFAAGVRSSFNSAFSGVGSVFTGTLAAAGVQASLSGLVDSVRSSMDQLEATGKASAALGMTAEGFQKLAYAAKLSDVPIEGFSTAVKMLQNNLADAAAGTGPAAASLTGLGLSASALASMAPDQAIGKIADALNSIQNPAERTQAAMNLFGKQAGPELMDMLSQGSAGITAIGKQAEKAGVIFSAIDIAKMQQANQAMQKAGAVIQSVIQRVGVELAPYIEAAANAFIKLAEDSGGFGMIAVVYVGTLAESIATVADYLKLFQAGWYGAKAAALDAIGGMLLAMETAGGAIDKLISAITGIEFSGTAALAGVSMEGVAAQAATATVQASQAFEAFSSGENHTKVMKFFDSVKAASEAAANETAKNQKKMTGAFKGIGDAAAQQEKAVTDALAGMQKDLDQFGMTDVQKKAADFAGMAGVTPEQIAQFQALQKQLEDKTAHLDLEKQATEMATSLQTPLEKYEAEITKLNKLRETDVFQKNPELYARGVQAARKALEGPAMEAAKPASLVMANSQEEFRLRAEASMNAMNKDDIPKQQLDQSMEQTDLLSSINDRLDFTVI